MEKVLAQTNLISKKFEFIPEAAAFFNVEPGVITEHINSGKPLEKGIRDYTLDLIDIPDPKPAIDVEA